MNSIGNMCYCYNEECNQKEWEKQGKTGKRQYTVVQAYYWAEDLVSKEESNLKSVKRHKIPKCPYCKKKMTITANLDYSM